MIRSMIPTVQMCKGDPPEVQRSCRHLCKACQHISCLIFRLRVQEPAATSQHPVGRLLLRKRQALGCVHE
jgi:hypothetical protein